MSVLVEKNVLVPMRDGIRLAADVYRPSTDGQYPVLLQRTPYNKELWPVTALTLDPIRAAAQGYVVVIEDVRARWASEGDVFFPYRDELEDGYDSIEWGVPRGLPRRPGTQRSARYRQRPPRTISGAIISGAAAP